LKSSVGWSVGFIFGSAWMQRTRLACNSSEKGTLPSGGLHREGRMQKRANQIGWHFAAAAVAAMALILLISVSGLHGSAGKMASSRPGIGYEPKSGLWGADEGAKLFAVRGPVEHQ
jgi:hypothetical protein